MLRHSQTLSHKGGARRPFLIRDTSLNFLNSSSNSQASMRRSGLASRSGSNLKAYGKLGATLSQHAFPLLSHTDFGNQDHAANTHWLMLGNYMPKRNKGTAPWFRGADTYSVLYSEQGRYEYQRYMMISRFPSEFKRQFAYFLNQIRASKRHPGRTHILPQEAIHWLLRMIVDNFNPQHVHYLAAIQTLVASGEPDMARDVWKIMERQQTWPDDKLIVAYLELCGQMGEKALALECWNRYCTEKRFLDGAEADPKPVCRIPFTLNRDETLYLPKWKKQFEHDPNLDVTDLNRFNTTRSIYRAMAIAMIAAGDRAMFDTLFDTLEEKLLTTPTPVPEPPNPHMVPKPVWGPHMAQATLQRTAWRLTDSKAATALGPETADIDQMHPRFHSNEQYLLTSVCDIVEATIRSATAATTADAAQEGGSAAATPTATPTAAGQEALRFASALAARATKVLGPRFAGLDTRRFFATILDAHRIAGRAKGGELLALMRTLLKGKAAAGGTPGEIEAAHPAMYLVVLKGFENDAAATTGFDPKAVMRTVAALLKEMASSPAFVWSADIHLAVMTVLQQCGTGRASEYFVKNVMRQFQWTSDYCTVLYREYRTLPDVELWAEHTKRMLVWTARYDVLLSETTKRLIEEDYGTIGVQVRLLRELTVFRFRDAEEKRIARNPVNQLPNPVMDYVSHALPFPDRDTGYPNEYGDLGQWRSPESGVSGVKGPEWHAPEMSGEAQRGYHAEWKNPQVLTGSPKLPLPWDRKYKQYARGTHPSYDMVYAGPFPEIFPHRTNFRRPTRWDFQSVQGQSKFKVSAPW